MRNKLVAPLLLALASCSPPASVSDVAAVGDGATTDGQSVRDASPMDGASDAIPLRGDGSMNADRPTTDATPPQPDATPGPDVVTTDTTQPGPDAVTPDTGPDVTTPLPAICNNTGSTLSPPAQFGHVIMILLENKSFSSVFNNGAAAYFNSLALQCGYSTGFVDNTFDADLPSEPHYLGLTSGSNCDTGVGDTGQTPGATNCITDDADPGCHTLGTQSIFNQVPSWAAYQESMPSSCGPFSCGEYACKHNPPVYYTALSGSCNANDVPIAHVNCLNSVNAQCATPDNAFTQALAGDTLPAFVFVTPDLINDMHDGTIQQGDNWLHTYLPLVFASAAYTRGDVAIYVLWDEAETAGYPMPNLFISPYTPPTQASDTMNLFAVLRAAESQLGISTYLGCAGGTPPGGIGSCAAGSTTDIRSIFNM